MGVNKEISWETFPEQGSYLNRKVEVIFHYNTMRAPLQGTIVRDDAEGITIIRLDDGRFVLGTECQYSPI